MKTVSFKKAVELFGGTNLTIKKGYYDCHGFFDMNGKTYYITSGDLRMRQRLDKNGERQATYCGIMYREAKDRKDYRGGINRWDFESKLFKMGYLVGNIPYKTC